MRRRLKSVKQHVVWEKYARVPGHYEYRFVVDGNWTLGPDGRRKVLNVFSSANPIREEPQ
jgi:hypothetical protein